MHYPHALIIHPWPRHPPLQLRASPHLRHAWALPWRASTFTCETPSVLKGRALRVENERQLQVQSLASPDFASTAYIGTRGVLEMAGI